MNKRFPELHNFNDMYTPPEAINSIEKYLPKNKIYWEACYGLGHMADELSKHGFTVVGNVDIDCLQEEPDKWDVFMTNPPFNGNKKFFKRAIELGKPFVFLCRLEHLGGVEASKLFKNLNIQIVIPKRRINYITPKMMRGEKVGGSPFHSVWVTYGLNLPKQIIYEDEIEI